MLPRNNEKPWRIYTLKDPLTLEVRYVGITTAALPLRLRGHVTAARIERPTHRTNWVNSLTSEGLAPIIEEVDSGVGEWEKTEQSWIARFKANGARLTNSTDGGNGSLGHPCSEEYRERLRREMAGAPRRGNPANWKHTAENRAAISAGLMGRKHSEETKRKISEAQKGRAFSETTLAKMRAVVKTPEHRRRLSLANTGENGSMAKLTAETVMEIRRRWAAGEPQNKLGAEFGVRGQTINGIGHGKSWKHLPVIPRPSQSAQTSRWRLARQWGTVPLSATTKPKRRNTR
jgi:hypothetical protein